LEPGRVITLREMLDKISVVWVGCVHGLVKNAVYRDYFDAYVMNVNGYTVTVTEHLDDIYVSNSLRCNTRITPNGERDNLPGNGVLMDNTFSLTRVSLCACCSC